MPYSKIAASAQSTGTTDWNGTSFAAPKVAADIINLKFDLDNEGISLSELNTESVINLISVDGAVNISSLSEVSNDTLINELNGKAWFNALKYLVLADTM